MGWLPSAPNGIAMCQDGSINSHWMERTATVTKTIMIGVDLAKNVIQLHAARMTGEVEYRKQLSREKFRRFMAEQPPALVVMEACGSAHHWARVFQAHGHTVRLMPTRDVRPYVRGNKTDRADAAGILEADRCGQIASVAVKTPEQQGVQAQHRVRERLKVQRISLLIWVADCQA